MGRKEERTAVLFDYDDCLAPTESVALGAAYNLVVREWRKRTPAELPFTKEQFIDRFPGQTFRKILETIAQCNNQLFSLSTTEIESLVEEEMEGVIEALRNSIAPSPGANEVLELLDQRRVTLAVVSSSAPRRLSVCLERTGQAAYIPPKNVFSVEMLGVRRSKPDPAIYLHALRELGIPAPQAIAIEDSIAGVNAALGAGIRTIGYVGALPEPLRRKRALAHFALGSDVRTVIPHWDDFMEVYEELTQWRVSRHTKFGKRWWLAQ